jgi:hypothetical protein
VLVHCLYSEQLPAEWTGQILPDWRDRDNDIVLRKRRDIKYIYESLISITVTILPAALTALPFISFSSSIRLAAHSRGAISSE